MKKSTTDKFTGWKTVTKTKLINLEVKMKKTKFN